MKEVIKQFVDMMEEDPYEGLNRYEEGRDWERRAIRMSSEYQALKSLANAPVAKMEVTDKMLNIAKMEYNIARTTRTGLKAALEAVFDHIEDKFEKVCSGCGVNLYQDVCDCAPEFNEKHLEKELISDGWILSYGKKPNLSDDTIVSVVMRGDDKPDEYNQPIEDWHWLFASDGFADDADIIAYRIISEPEENIDCSHPNIGRFKDGSRRCLQCGFYAVPKRDKKKQPLLAYLYEKDFNYQDGLAKFIERLDEYLQQIK